jgi:hypothetical protein
MRFFVGLKANLFSNKVTLTTQDPETYNSAIFIPSFETGYMILINDLLFITPTAAIGYKTNLRSELKADEKKAVGLFGISIGQNFRGNYYRGLRICIDAKRDHYS